MRVSKNKKPIITTKGPVEGECNVCGAFGKLTEDHTPPKGCYKPKQVELQFLARRFSNEQLGRKSHFSQNGVKYRTLCQKCNNTLLGAMYDPPFIEFVNHIAQLLSSNQILQDVVFVPGKPQAIMRSLLGHLSAQGVQRYRKGPLTEALRNYFIDTSTPLPEGINIYYWAYPHRSHVMVRDAAYIPLGASEPFALWFIKFFPIAFLVSWNGPQEFPFPVQNLDLWRAVPYELEVKLPITLYQRPLEDWPEAPTEHSVLAFGAEAINVIAGK